MIYTLALRYARSALALAKKENLLEEYRDCLQVIKKIFQDSKKLVAILENDKITTHKKSQAIKNIFSNKNIPKNVYNLLQVLVTNNRFFIFTEMVQIFEELYRKEKNSLIVQVTTSEELKDNQKEKIQQGLQNRFNCNVEIEKKIDKNILGGVIVQAGSYRIDGSIRNFLTKIHNSI